MKIKTLCLDLDGTLYIDRTPYPGALQTLRTLAERYRIAFVTNTTSMSVAAIQQEMLQIGFTPEPGSIFNPSRVARDQLMASGRNSGILLAEEAAREDYLWFREVEPGHPDCHTVLIGTEGYNLTFRDLEGPLEALLKGADLCTLQKNRFYVRNNRFALDMGPITAALEYASGRNATLFGKPSKSLFTTVAHCTGCALHEMVMVGDDVEFDVFGSMDLGLPAVLVRTGKYRQEFVDALPRKADWIIDAIADLPELLPKIESREAGEEA